MTKSRKQDMVLFNTTRDLESLLKILEEPYLDYKPTDQFPKPKIPRIPPLRNTISKCCDILKHHRNELIRAQEAALQRLDKDDALYHEAESRISRSGNKNVIKPAPVIAKRSAKVFAAELKLVDTMFKEMLIALERLKQ